MTKPTMAAALALATLAACGRMSTFKMKDGSVLEGEVVDRSGRYYLRLVDAVQVSKHPTSTAWLREVPPSPGEMREHLLARAGIAEHDPPLRLNPIGNGLVLLGAAGLALTGLFVSQPDIGGTGGVYALAFGTGVSGLFLLSGFIVWATAD